MIFNITNNYVVLRLAQDSVSTGSLSAAVSELNNLDVTGSNIRSSSRVWMARRRITSTSGGMNCGA